MSKHIKPGFTLAEVLIVIGVIGIVAAFVLPSMLNKTNDYEYKGRFKKSYADLSLATQQFMGANGTNSLNNMLTSSDSMKEAYKPFLTISKECDEGSSAGVCWHRQNNWHSYDNNLTNANVNNKAAVILNTGALVEFVWTSANCTDTCGTVNRCGWLEVDINGFQLPNKIGKDIFLLNLQADKLTPGGIAGDCDYNNCGSTISAGAFAGSGCAYWIVSGHDYDYF